MACWCFSMLYITDAERTHWGGMACRMECWHQVSGWNCVGLNMPNSQYWDRIPISMVVFLNISSFKEMCLKGNADVTNRLWAVPTVTGTPLRKHLQRSDKMRSTMCLYFYYKSKIKNSIYKSNIFSFKVFDLENIFTIVKCRKWGKYYFQHWL